MTGYRLGGSIYIGRMGFTVLHREEDKGEEKECTPQLLRDKDTRLLRFFIWTASHIIEELGQ